MRFETRWTADPGRASMAAERKTKLSKNLLRMKFMQRGLDSETKKQLEEEEKKIISEEHCTCGTSSLNEPFPAPIVSIVFFQKLMLQMNAKNKVEEVEDETVELDVSDEEMARRYETLVGTIGKKFARKRDRANYEEDENRDVKPVTAKKMFLKPHD
ncbi:hypothetical protein MC885_001020 [Smutsia gigantea]|nr:hypothetical protein MC885_001020 [Smutsia gigantea]